MKNNKNKTITLAGVDIDPGKHAIVKLPLADLYTQTDMSIPIHVFHGKSAGPKVFISSVIHGDEINSIEIIRRVHAQRWLKHINGTLITFLSSMCMVSCCDRAIYLIGGI